MVNDLNTWFTSLHVTCALHAFPDEYDNKVFCVDIMFQIPCDWERERVLNIWEREILAATVFFLWFFLDILLTFGTIT